MYIGLHVKYLYYCQFLMKLKFSRHIFEHFSNTKFHENTFSGSRVISCGQSDRRTDMTKLTVTFRSVANAQTTISTKQSRPFTESEISLTCSSLDRILNQLNASYTLTHHSLKTRLILFFSIN
jgi:hypothetical protein